MNARSVLKNLRIVRYIDAQNQTWYYVQRRFMGLFWLISMNREGYASLEMAMQEVQHYVFEQA